MTEGDPANAIRVWLSVHRPSSLLIVAPERHELAGELAHADPARDTHWLAPEPETVRALADRTYDAALVLNALERMSKADAGILLGRLRDVHTRRLLVLLRVGSRWEEQLSHWRRTDMIAYGLGLEVHSGPGSHAQHLYRFDIDDYKRTPEWLNPGNWAHPELWDKYRW